MSFLCSFKKSIILFLSILFVKNFQLFPNPLNQFLRTFSIAKPFSPNRAPLSITTIINCGGCALISAGWDFYGLWARKGNISRWPSILLRSTTGVSHLCWCSKGSHFCPPEGGFITGRKWLIKEWRPFRGCAVRTWNLIIYIPFTMKFICTVWPGVGCWVFRFWMMRLRAWW